MATEPGACAIFYPPRENFLEAIQEALEDQGKILASLCTDGRRIAWLPHRPAGWWPVSAAVTRAAS